MNCEETMERYLLLDKNQHVPLKLIAHLVVCRKCRNDVIAFSQAEHLISEPLKKPSSPAEVAAIMKKIHSLVPSVTVENAASIRSWIIAGICMVLCFCISPQLPVIRWFFSNSGSGILIPLYLVLGITLAIYCVLFVATHQDFFVKKFDLFESLNRIS